MLFTCFQNSMLLLINGFTFNIMNIQNNRSLEFEWVSMLAPFIRSVNDWKFPWLRNIFVKFFQDWLNSVQWCQGNFTKNAGQKMFILISWQTHEGLKIHVNYSIIEATQFLLWHQVKYVLTESFCQDALKNWLGRQRSLRRRKVIQVWLTLGVATMLLEAKSISNQSLMVLIAWLP